MRLMGRWNRHDAARREWRPAGGGPAAASSGRRLPDGDRVVPPGRRRTADLLASSLPEVEGGDMSARVGDSDVAEDGDLEADVAGYGPVATAQLWLARVEAELELERLRAHRQVVADHLAVVQALREATDVVPLAPLLTPAQEYRGGGGR